VKKGRHRRYEEARNLKRGPELDVEALFADLEGEPAVVAAVVEDSSSDDAEFDTTDYEPVDVDADRDGAGYGSTDDIEA